MLAGGARPGERWAHGHWDSRAAMLRDSCAFGDVNRCLVQLVSVALQLQVLTGSWSLRSVTPWVAAIP